MIFFVSKTKESTSSRFCKRSTATMQTFTEWIPNKPALKTLHPWRSRRSNSQRIPNIWGSESVGKKDQSSASAIFHFFSSQFKMFHFCHHSLLNFPLKLTTIIFDSSEKHTNVSGILSLQNICVGALAAFTHERAETRVKETRDRGISVTPWHSTYKPEDKSGRFSTAVCHVEALKQTHCHWVNSSRLPYSGN